MEEFKEFYNEVKGMDKKDLIKAGIPKFVGMLNKAKQIGFAKVVKEIPDIADMIRGKIALFEINESINIIRQFMPLMFDTVVEYISINKELQDELKSQGNAILAISLDDEYYSMTITLENGEFSYQLGVKDNYDVKLVMNRETFQKFISGATDPMASIMTGEVKAEGDINKALNLKPVLDIISDQFGIDFLSS